MLDPAGKTIRGDFLLFPSPVLPRNAAAGRDGEGNFVVVWEQRERIDGRSRVLARRLDSRGEPLAETFTVNASARADQLEPDVAADASGRFLIVWQERTFANGRSLIKARRYAKFGVLEGSAFALTSAGPDDPQAPRVTCAPGGACWVAWESVDRATRQSHVRAQRLDTVRNLTGTDFRVGAEGSGRVWLVHLSADSNGDVDVRWEKLDAGGGSLGTYRQVYAQDGTVTQPETLFSGAAPLNRGPHRPSRLGAVPGVVRTSAALNRLTLELWRFGFAQLQVGVATVIASRFTKWPVTRKERK